MSVDEYLSNFAQHVVRELEPIIRVKEVTSNPDLLGKYAEAAIRRLMRRAVHPMHVSNGAVLDYPMPAKLKQLDAIIWAPFPAPAVFEVDDFALVPRSSAFGVIEIKRTNYRDVDTELEAFINEAPGIIAARGGGSRDDPAKAVLGIVGAITAPSARLTRLIEARHVVGLFETNANGTRVRANDVLTLINCLHYIGWRYRMQASSPEPPQLASIGEQLLPSGR